jgi:nucleoside-diphosphate-sugar epimerase/predicted dehydrogenase
VGCGAVSQEHYVPACRSISECTIEWFVDKDLQRANELAKSYGHGRVTADYKEVLDRVDAAIVALPNYLHSTVSTDFLVKNCDVLCEKPIATSVSDAKLIVAVSQKAGARLAVNHVRRAYDCFRIAKQLLNSGIIGGAIGVDCEEGEVYWPASSYILDRRKAGGGVLIDRGIHTIDILQWLFDAKLDLISYQDDGLGGVEANSDINARIVSEDEDIPCRILLSRTRVLEDNVTIRGDKCSLEIRLSDRRGVYLKVDGSKYRISSPGRLVSDPFAEQIKHFLDKSSTDYVTGIEALRSLEFVDACYHNRRDLSYPWETCRKSVRSPSFPGKILVVGASGFVGTRLVETLSLNLGWEVRAGIHSPSSAFRLARLPVELVDCDLLDPSQVARAVEGCEVVINCAQDRSGEKILEVFDKGTSNLLRAATEHGVKKVVHLSSAAVLGFSQGKRLLDERSPYLRTLDPYVRGKIKSERIALSYSHTIPVVVLRPTLIYGPFSAAWTVGIIERLKNHQIVVVGENCLASLVYVDDVVNAIVLAIESDEAEGVIFNLNNDLETVLWKDYVRKYSQALGVLPRTSAKFDFNLHKLRAFFIIVADSITSTKETIMSPEFLLLIARIPLAVKIGQMVLRGRRRNRMENELVLASERDRRAELRSIRSNYARKYVTMDKGLYRVMTNRAIFSSRKARSVLGFNPTPFEDGIAKTLEWVQWARYGRTRTD